MFLPSLNQRHNAEKSTLPSFIFHVLMAFDFEIWHGPLLDGFHYIYTSKAMRKILYYNRSISHHQCRVYTNGEPWESTWSPSARAARKLLCKIALKPVWSSLLFNSSLPHCCLISRLVCQAQQSYSRPLEGMSSWGQWRPPLISQWAFISLRVLQSPLTVPSMS